MAFQLLTRIFLVLMVVAGNQVNANWSMTFYQSYEQCTGEDTDARKHYYVFSGDSCVLESNPTLQSECFVPGGDRIQQGIDTNMVCSETWDGGITMQECKSDDRLFKLKNWSWSVAVRSSCTWGPLRPYVNQEGICQNFKSEPTKTSQCYDGDHELRVQGQDSMSMHFSCGCSGTSVTCKSSYLEKHKEKRTNVTVTAADAEDDDADTEPIKGVDHDIWTGCKMQ